MRKLNAFVPILAAALILHAVPSFTEEGTTEGLPGNMEVQKDECLLVASYCPDNVDSIQQRISKLQTEIRRGTDVYTTEELRVLNKKLDDELEVYRRLNRAH